MKKFSKHFREIFFLKDTNNSFYVLHLLSWLANVFGAIFILAAHEHYTIDVMIAFLLTSRLFLYYHSLANHSVLHTSSDNRFVHWFPMFVYFEKNIQKRLPNVCSIPWPFSIIFPYDQEEQNNDFSVSTRRKQK